MDVVAGAELWAVPHLSFEGRLKSVLLYRAELAEGFLRESGIVPEWR